jgi:hypothetical protein
MRKRAGASGFPKRFSALKANKKLRVGKAGLPEGALRLAFRWCNIDRLNALTNS